MSPQVPQLRVITGGSESLPGDGELVRAFLAGDGDAFGALIARHQGVVFRVVRRYAPRPEDARDLCQRTFLQAFEAAERSLPKLAQDGDVPFRAWLLRIAVNLSKNHLRDASRWPSSPETSIDAERSSAPATEAYEKAEQQALVRAAVLALPNRQREVFTLRIDAGLSFAEVGQTLGITEGNAKAHFHHAVQRLKEEVAKRSSPEVPT